MRAWTEVIPRDGEWTLACAHSSVTSEAVAAEWEPPAILAVFRRMQRTYPGISAEAAAMASIRVLMGCLLTQQSGCSCAEQAFHVVTGDGQWWTEDVR